MFYAEESFKHAKSAAEYILKNPVKENDLVFYPLITAVYVLYGKPFGKNYGMGSLKEDFVATEHLDLHKELLQHRDQTYVHSDATRLEIPDAGKANHVRLKVRQPRDKSLFCSQFQATRPRMDRIISLCQLLQEKARGKKIELINQYKKSFPNEVGEYVLNIDQQGEEMFVPTKTIIE